MDRSKGESSVCDIAAVEWRELRSTMGKLSVPKKIKEKLFGQAYVEWEWLIERRDIDGLDGVFLSDGSWYFVMENLIVTASCTW